MNELSGSPVYLRGRFYGLQSILSVDTEPPKNRPIIQYGLNSGPYTFNSTDQFTISENLTRSITLNPLSFNGNNLEVGWIVYIYGGNQTGTSRTEIELKLQEALSVQIQTGRTFRMNQLVSLVLRSDAKKNLTGIIKSYNTNTGVMVIDVTNFEGTGTYPIGPIDFWDVTVSGNEAISTDYMLARVNTVDTQTDPEHPIINVTAYQDYGSGTYSTWTIYPQWNNAVNYVRNLNLSAYECSTGPSISGPDGNPIGAFFGAFQGDSTGQNVNTSNPPYIISNYTLTTVKGLSIVMEDEYATNRPYLKRKVTSSMSMETVTVTDTYTYDSQGQPTIHTVTEIENSPMDVEYTFTDNDFNPGDLARYTPGSPAVYSNGQMIGTPTPSRYTRSDLADGSTTYQSRNYFQQNEQYFPDGPEEPPAYRPLLIRTVTKAIGVGSNPAKPQPDWFFWIS